MPQLHDIKRKIKILLRITKLVEVMHQRELILEEDLRVNFLEVVVNLNPTFEGGQLRLVKKLPHMRGFTKIFKKDYVALNLDDLSVIFQNDSISIEDFKKKGVIKNKQMIKILGNGEVSKSLSLEVHAISSSAKAKIEKAGGEVKIIE